MSRLTHDINQYGVMIQPKANTTLKAMTKAELIEYIRTLEHNYNVAVDFNERQARNVEAELKKWQHYKDLEEQGKLIVVQEDVLVEIYNLVHDVGPAEIAEQIRADNLNSWSNRWRASIKAKLAELKGTEE